MKHLSKIFIAFASVAFISDGTPMDMELMDNPINIRVANDNNLPPVANHQPSDAQFDENPSKPQQAFPLYSLGEKRHSMEEDDATLDTDITSKRQRRGHSNASSFRFPQSPEERSVTEVNIQDIAGNVMRGHMVRMGMEMEFKLFYRLLSGKFRVTFPDVLGDKTVYQGDFKNGLMNGQGTLSSVNGNTYEGSFVDGLRDGYGVQSNSAGDTIKGNFENGLINGQVIITKQGRSYEGISRRGVLISQLVPIS